MPNLNKRVFGSPIDSQLALKLKARQHVAEFGFGQSANTITGSQGNTIDVSQKLQLEKNLVQSEMARIREEQRIENKRMLSEPELLAKSEKYRFLRERLDQLQQESADFQKSD